VNLQTILETKVRPRYVLILPKAANDAGTGPVRRFDCTSRFSAWVERKACESYKKTRWFEKDQQEKLT
jgi:hypothetical protein